MRKQYLFATTEPGRGFRDLETLKELVGEARLVALGEGTHGTHEFFRLKHRIVEFLATEMGFTVFSIEANMPEAYRVNEFVLNGEGDPKELLKEMSAIWNAQEVLDMILWMREFNKSSGSRIEFTGFDMQSPKVAIEKCDRCSGEFGIGLHRKCPANLQRDQESTHAICSYWCLGWQVPTQPCGRKTNPLQRLCQNGRCRERVGWLVVAC